MLAPPVSLLSHHNLYEVSLGDNWFIDYNSVRVVLRLGLGERGGQMTFGKRHL